MCYECYTTYGTPDIINEKTVEASKLITEVFDNEYSGGHCHLVLEDFNIEDIYVANCLQKIRRDLMKGTPSPDKLAIQKKCMEAFQKLSIKERASAIAISGGWVKVPQDGVLL